MAVCSRRRPARGRYQKAYQDYARALRREYPRLQTKGDLFHPGDLRVALSQAMQLTFFSGLAVSIMGKGARAPRPPLRGHHTPCSRHRPLLPALVQVRVPKDQMLGPEGAGFKVSMATLDGGRIGIAGQARTAH